jgi:hypothetical protein
MNSPIAKRIEKKRSKSPVIAGMPFLPNGKVGDYKLRKVGYDVIESTYDVDVYQDGYEDWMLINEVRIKRVFYK